MDWNIDLVTAPIKDCKIQSAKDDRRLYQLPISPCHRNHYTYNHQPRIFGTRCVALVALEEIEELAQHPKDKFFAIEEYMVDKNAKLTHISTGTSGKANQTLNFHMHYVVPFRNVKHTYFAVHYHEWMSNSANDFEKKSPTTHSAAMPSAHLIWSTFTS